jgi:hypothetical protein
MLALLLATSLAAPVPKTAVKPLPDGLAGEWVLHTESEHTPRSSKSATYSFEKDARVLVWSFDGDRIRVYEARLVDAETVEEKSKKEVKAFRLAWDKEKPEQLGFALDKPGKDEMPLDLWRLKRTDKKLDFIRDPADPKGVPADFDLPRHGTRSLKGFVKFKSE